MHTYYDLYLKEKKKARNAMSNIARLASADGGEPGRTTTVAPPKRLPTVQTTIRRNETWKTYRRTSQEPDSQPPAVQAPLTQREARATAAEARRKQIQRASALADARTSLEKIRSENQRLTRELAGATAAAAKNEAQAERVKALEETLAASQEQERVLNETINANKTESSKKIGELRKKLEQNVRNAKKATEEQERLSQTLEALQDDQKRLQDDKANLEVQLATSRKEAERIKVEIDKASAAGKQLPQLRGQLSSQAELLKKAAAAVSNQKNQLEAAQSELRDRNARVARIQADLDRAIVERQRAEATIANLTETAESDAAEQEAAVQQLRDELAAKANESKANAATITDLKRHLKTLEANTFEEVNAVETNLAEANKRLLEANEEAERLKGQLRGLEGESSAKLTSVKQVTDALQAELEAQRKRADEATQSIQKLTQALADAKNSATAKVEEVQEALDAAIAKNKDQAASQAELLEEFNNAKQTADHAKVVAEEAQNQLIQLQDRLTDLNEQLEAAKDQNEQAAQQNAELKGQLEEAGAQNAAQEQKNFEQRETISELEAAQVAQNDELAALREAQEIAKQKASTLAKNLTDLGTEKEALEAELKKAADKAAANETEATKRDARIKELQRALAAIEPERSAAEAEFEKYNAKIADQARDIKALEETKEDLTKTNTSLQNQLAEQRVAEITALIASRKTFFDLTDPSSSNPIADAAAVRAQVKDLSADKLEKLLTDLRADVDGGLTRLKDRIEAERQAAAATVAKQKRELDEAKNLQAETTARLEAAEAQATEAAADATLQATLDSKVQELAEAQAAAEEATASVKDIEATLAKTIADRDKLVGELANKSTQLEGEELQKEQLRNRIIALVARAQSFSDAAAGGAAPAVSAAAVLNTRENESIEDLLELLEKLQRDATGTIRTARLAAASAQRDAAYQESLYDKTHERLESAKKELQTFRDAGVVTREEAELAQKRLNAAAQLRDEAASSNLNRERNVKVLLADQQKKLIELESQLAAANAGETQAAQLTQLLEEEQARNKESWLGAFFTKRLGFSSTDPTEQQAKWEAIKRDLEKAVATERALRDKLADENASLKAALVTDKSFEIAQLQQTVAKLHTARNREADDEKAKREEAEADRARADRRVRELEAKLQEWARRAEGIRGAELRQLSKQLQAESGAYTASNDARENERLRALVNKLEQQREQLQQELGAKPQGNEPPVEDPSTISTLTEKIRTLEAQLLNEVAKQADTTQRENEALTNLRALFSEQQIKMGELITKNNELASANQKLTRDDLDRQRLNAALQAANEEIRNANDDRDAAIADKARLAEQAKAKATAATTAQTAALLRDRDTSIEKLETELRITQESLENAVAQLSETRQAGKQFDDNSLQVEGLSAQVAVLTKANDELTHALLQYNAGIAEAAELRTQNAKLEATLDKYGRAEDDLKAREYSVDRMAERLREKERRLDLLGQLAGDKSEQSKRRVAEYRQQMVAELEKQERETKKLQAALRQKISELVDEERSSRRARDDLAQQEQEFRIVQAKADENERTRRADLKQREMVLAQTQAQLERERTELGSAIAQVQAERNLYELRKRQQAGAPQSAPQAPQAGQEQRLQAWEARLIEKEQALAATQSRREAEFVEQLAILRRQGEFYENRLRNLEQPPLLPRATPLPGGQPGVNPAAVYFPPDTGAPDVDDFAATGTEAAQQQTADTSGDTSIDRYILSRKLGVSKYFVPNTTAPAKRAWQRMRMTSERADDTRAYAAVGGPSEINAPFSPQGIGTQRMVDLALRSGNDILVKTALDILNSWASKGKTADDVDLKTFLVAFFVGRAGQELVESFVGGSSALGNSKDNVVNWITILLQQVRDKNKLQEFEKTLTTLQSSARAIQDYNDLLVSVMRELKDQSAQAMPQTGLEKNLRAEDISP